MHGDYYMNILFLCVANSIRSQMAEGLAKNILGDDFTIFSAGINSSYVHPMAIEVMAEIGIDISQQTSKSIFKIDTKKIDKVIILYTNNWYDPVFSEIEDREHWPLPNPTMPSDEGISQLEQFRKIRDILIEKINDLKTRLQRQ